MLPWSRSESSSASEDADWSSVDFGVVLFLASVPETGEKYDAIAMLVKADWIAKLQRK